MKDDEVTIEGAKAWVARWGYNPDVVDDAMFRRIRKRTRRRKQQTLTDELDGSVLTVLAIPGEEHVVLGIRDTNGNELSAVVPITDLLDAIRKVTT